MTTRRRATMVRDETGAAVAVRSDTMGQARRALALGVLDGARVPAKGRGLPTVRATDGPAARPAAIPPRARTRAEEYPAEEVAPVAEPSKAPRKRAARKATAAS